MRTGIARTASAVVVCLTAAAVQAERPEQFRVWGSAGAALAPAPEGWREAAPPAAALVPCPPTPAERRRGFVLFAREPLTPTAPRAALLPAERTEQLEACAARGEYEPLSVLVRAIVPLGKVSARVGPLRSAGGGEIPADHVDVRWVRCIREAANAKDKTYRLRPFLLERRPAVAIPAGSAGQVWLTVKVPPAAAAGTYTAALQVRADGREAADVKLTLRVLPLTLPPAPIEMGVFYPRIPADDAMLARQLADVREHGCHGVEPPLHVQVKTRDRAFGADDVAATQAHCRRMLDAMGKAFGQRRPLTFGVGHQIAYYWDQGKNWFAFWPHGERIEADLLRAIDVVEKAAAGRGKGPLRVYALDEAGAHNLLDEAAYYYALIKRKRPHLQTWTTIGGGMAMGHDEIGRLSAHVDVFSTNRFTPAIARALVARGKLYGVYNGSGHTPAGARLFHGFYGWKTGARQIAQWCYHFGNAALDKAGLRAGDEGYVYLADDGPLPSIMWEAVREGIDDYRYTELLWRSAAAAKASGKPGAKAAAAEAERALRDVLGQIGWGVQALHGGERTDPPPASALRKWRRRIAEQIVKLQAFAAGKAAATPPPAAPRPGPLELPWARPAASAETFGREMLPAGGGTLQADMKPWRIEAWKGKGAGRLDASTGHAGKGCVRIDVPAAGGSEAVTVLVWPSWGGGKLDVRLAGGRRYELSAWVRCEGRSTPPSVRIALPAGAAAASRDGADEPAPDGWQRVWCRAEMSFPAVPKYLAVWVQGPGTVWIDDLSLREVIPPPLRLTLDQPEYDARDAVGRADVTVARHITPARVRLSLVRRGGEPVAELTAPFAADAPVAAAAGGKAGALTLLAPVALRRCRVLFQPAALPPGDYLAEVQALDAAANPLATATAAFTRLAD